MSSKKSLLRNALRRNLQLETLESRQLMTIGCSLDTAGNLNIRGDDTYDKVTVYKSGANTMVQGINSAGVVSTFNMGAGVKTLDIRTYGGDDVVNNTTNLSAVILGGNGNDTLLGGSDIDLIMGEMGNDYINGNGGSDYIIGGGGNDVIRGGADNDYIEGDDASLESLSVAAEQALPFTNNDVILGGAGQDQINGQLGRDWIYGGAALDTVDGGRGDDMLYGDDGANSYYVSEDGQYSGDDLIRGGDGNDTLYGGYGEDFLYGGIGNDVLYGGANNDRLFGNSGVDSLFGEAGDDFLDSGSVAETSVVGGDGNDFNAYVTAVNGASFNDIAQGNAGNCFMLASMSAAIARGVNLQSRITYTGDGWYSVALFKKNSNGTYSPTTINVYFDGGTRSYDPTAHFRNQEGESWHIIMNRALATLLNINLATVTGGYAGNILGAILGRTPSSSTWVDNTGFVSPLYRDPTLELLFAVGNSVPTVVGTRNTVAELGSNRFVADHVYAVHSVFISNYTYNLINKQFVPQYSVLLYNPWGRDNDSGNPSGDNSDGLLVVTAAEFKRNFDEITFA